MGHVSGFSPYKAVNSHSNSMSNDKAASVPLCSINNQTVVKKKEAMTNGSDLRKRFGKEQLKALCGREFLNQRVPATYWLPRYKREDFLPDLIAGITVGLTLIPQSIAYASLAGLEPQYGLYSSFLGSFVYIIFGTTKEVNLGPAALLSLLTFNYTHHLGPEFAVLLCFFSGCLELLFGLLQLGFLVNFVSSPVVSGFTSAAAIMIASAQVKGLLGIKFDAESFIETWKGVFQHIGEARQWDVVLGICCCATLLSLKFLGDILRKCGCSGENSSSSKKAVWFISTARNALVVIVCSALASGLESVLGEAPFILTGRVRSGLPPVQLPPFNAQVGNETYSFVEMASALGSGIIVTPVVAVISNLAIGKAFADGKMLDATQEMMTLGLCNIAGCLVGSMPVCGSFSRSAVSNASGIRSPLAGLYTGIMVLLSLSLLTPYFYFIPRATLASVIMCAVIFLVDLSGVKPMWRSNKRDLVTLIGTFLACLLLGMEIGIICGILISVSLLLYSNARPDVGVQYVSSDVSYLLLTPNLGLMFPAADHVRVAVQTACRQYEELHVPVVLDCSSVASLDYTAAQGMGSLNKDLSKRGHELIFYKAKGNILHVLKSVCSACEFKHAANLSELENLIRGTVSKDNEKPRA